MKALSKFVVVSGLVLASVSANAAFTQGMSLGQVDGEVSKRLGQGASLNVLAADAKAAGVSSAWLVSALMSQRQDAAKVVAALVAAGYPSRSVVDMVVSMGADRKSMNDAAVLAGANPSDLLDATAAGGDAGGGAGFSAGGSAGFGGAPSPSFGGGGGGGSARPSRS